MNFGRFWAVARKESLHVVRDRRSLAFALAIPALLLVLFGYALTLDVDDVPLAVWDQSATPLSREYLSGFEGSRHFRIAARTSSYREIEEALDHRRALLALVVPADFARALEGGRPARVQVLADGSDPNTATVALGYARAVTGAFAAGRGEEWARRRGGRPRAPAVDLRVRPWFNPDMESRRFIVPGLIAVILMVIAALLTSLTVSREWERGTMEQLISTPVKGPELVLGKLVPYFAVGMADVALVAAMGSLLFDVPFRGSLVLLFAVSAVFLAGALSMGLLVSILTKNQLLSNQLAMLLTFLPAFLLSGFVFPIRNMPAPIQAVTYLVPARYFITVLKGITLKGLGIRSLAPELGLLALFAAGVLFLSVLRFDKRLD